VPSAELEVCYGFSSWKRQADERKDEQHRFLVSTLHRRMKALHPLGVRYHERVNRHKLAQMMRSSGALLYPGWFQETYCLSIAEARAAGMRIVATPIAAIPETLGDWGTLVEGDWISDDYQARFVEAAVSALMAESLGSPPQTFTRLQMAETANRDLDWQGVAEQWHTLFGQLMAEAEHGAMPGYREYREAA
jgi:glycosyltransferase involved in cell wall biosynthesis